MKPTTSSSLGTESPSESSTNPHSRMIKEGADGLLSCHVNVSGRKEPVELDKYFHIVEQAWNAFLEAKPNLVQRFSYAEFKHISALMLYHRIEYVKFETFGVEPSANVRVPLPKNVHVYRPIWRVLSNIGVRNNEDLKVTAIPDAVLPRSENLTDPMDIKNRVSGRLYDWVSSWEDVQKARAQRPTYKKRFGYRVAMVTNEGPGDEDQTVMLQQLAELRILRENAARDEANRSALNNEYDPAEGGRTVASINADLLELRNKASEIQRRMTTIRTSTCHELEVYTLIDDIIAGDPGGYGAWLHCDPRLWVEYDQVVETLTGTPCAFSLYACGS